MDMQKLRGLVFIAQQRRARYINIKIPIPTAENENEWRDAERRYSDALVALNLSTAALLDFLQAELDVEVKP